MAENVRGFVVALGSLQTDQERERFLKNLLSPDELKMVSQRWVAIRLLLEGVKQRAAKTQTGMGIATVSRAANQIKEDGDFLEEVRKRCQEM